MLFMNTKKNIMIASWFNETISNAEQARCGQPLSMHEYLTWSC